MIIAIETTRKFALGKELVHCLLPPTCPTLPGLVVGRGSKEWMNFFNANKTQHHHSKIAALSRLLTVACPGLRFYIGKSRETSGTLRECQGRRSGETAPRCGEQSGLGVRVKCYDAPQAENMTGKRKPQWLRPQSQPSYLAWGVREGCFLVHTSSYLGRQT